MRTALLLSVLAMSLTSTLLAQAPKVLVGAIRWDAWHGQLGAPGQAVERALGPAQYHDRLPFFAEVRGEDDITINGTAPGVMNREIAYARQAGLDYWAFVTYPDKDPMSLGLDQYLASERRSDINFCLITEGPRWKDPQFARRVARLLAEKGYQHVLNGRPLLYLGFIDEQLIDKGFGGAKAFRAIIDDFCQSVIATGSARPYIVIMDHDPARGERWRREFGADALSSYAAQGNAIEGTYADLTTYAEKFWQRCLAERSAVVPIAMTGWDRRPRIARPMPWEKWQKPNEGMNRFYLRPTADQLAAHIREAVTWTKEHPAACPAQTVIIYAWNENDEGGWLVPTKGESTTRIEALSKALTTN